MAILRRESFRLYAMERDRKQILGFLLSKGITDMRETGFIGVNEPYINSKKNSEIASNAIKTLDESFPRKKKPALAFLRGRKTPSVQDISPIAVKSLELLQSAERVLLLVENIKSAKASILKCETQAELLSVWDRLPVSGEFHGTAHTSIYIGSLPGKHSVEDVLELLGGESGRIHVEIVYSAEFQTNLFIIAPIDIDLNTHLHSIGFVRPSYLDLDKPPSESKRDLEHQLVKLTSSVAEMENELEGLSQLVSEFEMLQHYFVTCAEKEHALNQMAQSTHSVVLEGLVPGHYVATVKAELESSFDCIFDVFELETR